MNAEKLAKLQAQVRLGGKGTARRKKKVVHKTAATDDKKLQSSLKKISVNQIPGIEEVNMIKDDGTVMHFNNPKVQASLASNTFAVAGHAETKQITELLPGILNQLGAESLSHLRKLAGGVGGLGPGDAAGMNDVEDDDDDVPDLVENFDEVCKDEVPSASHTHESNTVISETGSSKEEKGANEAEDDEDEDVPDLIENDDEVRKDEVPNVSETDESKAVISETDSPKEEKKCD